MRVIHRIAVMGATVLILAGVGTGAALADPPSTPSLDALVGISCPQVFVGSPTENSAGSLVSDYNATNPAVRVACWDDVNPVTGQMGDTITTKASGSGDTTCSITRPYGPDAEIAALNKNQMDGSAYCIDFVISERAPNATSTKDEFASLMDYALDWSYPVVSGQTNHQPATLTVPQLQDIYNCRVRTWGQVNGNSSDTTPIVPVIPQVGSGTRATWLAAMGITGVIPSCVVNGINGTNLIEENTGDSAGNVAQFTSSTAAEDIFPYSISDWIAQGPAVTGTGTPGTPDGATVGGHARPGVWDRANMALGQVTDDFGTTDDAVTTNDFGQPVTNPNWAFELDGTLYGVLRNGSSIPPFFNWICTNNTAQSDVVSYGFGTPVAGCDTLSVGD